MRAISVLCVSVASLWASAALADVYGHDYFKRSGAYVGSQQRPSQSGYSTPSRPYDDPAPYPAPNVLSADYLAAIAAARERVRAEAQLEAEREKYQRLESQARGAVEAEIAADSQARRSDWLASEASIQAAERDRLEATMAERRLEWEAKEARARQEAFANYQRDLREYSRRWDEANFAQEAQERSDAAETQERVINAHLMVAARYIGDGQQAFRDRRRTRDDAYANAARMVRVKRSAELRSEARATGEASYQAAALARLETAERARLADWDRQQSEFRLAAETRIERDAKARRLGFNREEAVLLAKARAEAEQELLQMEQAWTRDWTNPAHVQPDEPADVDPDKPVGLWLARTPDRTEPADAPSGPSRALVTTFLLTVLTGAGALLRHRMA